MTFPTKHGNIPLLAFLLCAAVLSAAGQSDDLVTLRENFLHPPDDSRIMMRWWWFGPSVEKPELERELRFMKEGGMGGVEVQPVYPLALDNPATGFHNFPYLSDEFIGDLHFASDKAREFGLRVDLTLGSGWPFGGPHIPVTQAAGKLRVVTLTLGPKEISVAEPHIETGEHLLAVFLSDGKGGQPRMLDPGTVADGRVTIPDAASGAKLLWFMASRTGMMVKRPAIGAEGFVLDHFDRTAIDTHLHTAGDRLMQAFDGKPPYSVFSDSLEVYGSDWTGDLLQEFRRRRGYDLTPFLPALVQDDGPETADIRYDWGETLTELINENYLTPLENWAKSHGTKFRSQTYGNPAVTLSSNALVDLPEGEGSNWNQFSTTRWASSASHLYGRNVTSAETWTWLHSPAFRATPLDMKAEADLFFLQGINQLIGHGWPYSPPSAGEPGWRFYAAAVFNQHNPWWMVMPDITGYLQRTSYLLRQGEPANDVAVLLPTADARAQFTAGKDSVSESMEQLLDPDLVPQILHAGFGFDFTDEEAIRNVGIRSPILILPNIHRIRLDTYRKIEAFAEGGGIVIAVGGTPQLAPGLRETRQDSPQVHEISQKLFEASSKKVQVVEDIRQLGAALASARQPEVAFSPNDAALGFIHRKSPSADIYFIANTGNQKISGKATFRTDFKSAEWWDPFSGARRYAGKSNTIDLDLQPYESRLLIFSNGPAEPPAKTVQSQSTMADLSNDWQVSFPALDRTVAFKTLHSWTEDPETQFYSGTAVYTKTIEVSSQSLRTGAKIFLDFGPGTPVEKPATGHPRMRAWLESPVREAAQVQVNGKPAGPVWKPPYEIEISSLLHAGKNELSITVGNLAINRLAGHSLPDYRLLNSRYGERFVAQDMDHLQPLPSGMLGPVTLISRRIR